MITKAQHIPQVYLVARFCWDDDIQAHKKTMKSNWARLVYPCHTSRSGEYFKRVPNPSYTFKRPVIDILELNTLVKHPRSPVALSDNVFCVDYPDQKGVIGITKKKKIRVLYQQKSYRMKTFYRRVTNKRATAHIQEIVFATKSGCLTLEAIRQLLCSDSFSVDAPAQLPEHKTMG